jgi:hypothetical protein
MDPHTFFFEEHDPVHHINGTAIIGGPGHVKTNDM